MKKLVTVCWSVVIEAEIPNETIENELFDFTQSDETAAINKQIIKDAYAAIQASDGEITDIGEV